MMEKHYRFYINRHSTINTEHAAIFCILVILPMILALAVLDYRINELRGMLDGAVQGLILNQDNGP